MAQISRFIFGFFSLFFLLFSYWQWNDPDPEIWVSIYGIAAIMAGLAAFNKFSVPILLLMAIASFIGGIYFFPASVREWVLQEWRQSNLSMKTPEMEEGRESFGLFFVSAVMSLLAYAGWQHKDNRNKGRNKFHISEQ